MHPDCIVVGAGLLGAFAAVEMAERGMKVALIDAANSARLLNDLGAELLLFRNGRPDALNSLRKKSPAYCRQVLEPLSDTEEFQTISELQLLSDSTDIERARRESRNLRENGKAVEFIPGDEIVAFDSNLSTEIVGALFFENIPVTGSRELYRNLWRLCDASERISVRWDTPAVGITVQNGKVAAVRSLEGPLETEHILIAAGAATLGIVSSIGIQLPMILQKRYRLVGQPMERLKKYVLSEFVSSNSGTRQDNRLNKNGELDVVLSVFFRENGHSLVGDGIDYVTVNQSLDRKALQGIRHCFDHVVPGCAHMVLEKVVSRLDVAVFDSLPVVGSVRDVEGLYLAVDQKKEKDLIAPALGDLAARVIVGDDITDVEQSLSPDRFPQTAPGGQKRVTD